MMGGDFGSELFPAACYTDLQSGLMNRERRDDDERDPTQSWSLKMTVPPEPGIVCNDIERMLQFSVASWA